MKVKPILLPIILSLLLASCTSAPHAAPSSAPVWQWSIDVAGATNKVGPSRAFLWIPPTCQRVRGVVFAQNNMEEEMILENPRFRDTMASIGFAEIWVAPSFNLMFKFNEGAGEIFNGMMNDLAAQSGYTELSYAPVAYMGHSAAASAPFYLAAWAPQRTLAALSISGQWPYFRDPSFAPDIWGARTIDFIPTLVTMGEYEAAESRADTGLQNLRAHPMMPMSMYQGPGESHFVASDAKIDYLALYIKKAAQYRIPAGWDGHSAPNLIPIDPTKSGWLVERWHKDRPVSAPPAPIGQYTGDPSQAFWYFDREMAEATIAVESAHRGKRADLLGYVQDGAISPQTNTHLQINLKFEPQDDGITFKLGTTFLDTVPGESPRPADWTGLPAGSPIGHATGGGPISIDRIIGPFEKLDANTFRVNFQKETIGNERTIEMVFAETHPGDDQYRPAVQQAHMYIPARNAHGADQHITFPLIPNQTSGAPSVKLNGTSDAGLPVSYYVREGPAQVQGDTLTQTTIPPRAKYPVAVTVVAWQYGRSISPQLKSADPVGCTFYITRPGISAPASAYVAVGSSRPTVATAPAGATQKSEPLPPVAQTSSKRTISVNFCNALAMRPTDLAGAESRVGNWNSIKAANGAALSLASVVDKDGVTVPGMTVNVAGGGAEYHVYDGGSNAALANEARLFNGVLDEFDGSPATIALTGIPYAHYNVFFYRSDDGDKRAGKFTIGTVSYYVRGGKGNPGGDGSGYVGSNCPWGAPTSAVVQGNYVEFTGLTGSTFTAAFSAVNAGDDVQRCKLVGFQIVEAQ